MSDGPQHDAVLGVRLRRAREDAKLSQGEAADRLGVSRVTLSRRENGHVPIESDEIDRMLQMYRGAVSERGTAAALTAGFSSEADEAPEVPSDDGRWEPSPVLRRNVPPEAYEVALVYLRRLERAGITGEQLEELERVLLDRRFAQAFSRTGREFSVGDHILLIDNAWRAIQDTLAIYGVHP